MRGIYFLVLAMGLTGCSEVIIRELVNGGDVCPSNEYNIVFQNMKDYNTLNNRGLHKDTVLMYKFRNPPAYKQMYDLGQGQLIEGYFYQMSPNPLCVGKSKNSKIAYKPVFFDGDTFVGKGDDFFNARIRTELNTEKSLALLREKERQGYDMYATGYDN